MESISLLIVSIINHSFDALKLDIFVSKYMNINRTKESLIISNPSLRFNCFLFTFIHIFLYYSLLIFFA